MFFMYLKEWGALVIALFSFIVATIAYIKAWKVQKLDEEIKQNQIEQIKQEKERQKTSCVEARLFQASKSNYILRIWNSGGATAYNIKVHIENGSNFSIYRDKTPYEKLESNKSFDQRGCIHLGTAPKFKVTTEWQNEAGKTFQKEQIVDI